MAGTAWRDASATSCSTRVPKNRVRDDDKPAGLQWDEGGEGDVDFTFGARLEDRELQPLGARHFLHQVSDHGLGSRVWVRQQGDHLGLGNQLGNELHQLGHQLGREEAEAGEVATGSRETGDEANTDRVTDAGENDRDCRGRAFRCECGGRAPR
jgi:hypothetical protein